MKNFVVYKTNGEIVTYGTCQDEFFEAQAEPDQFVIEAKGSENQYVEDGVVVDMPNKPFGEYVFNYESKQWVFDEQSAMSAAIIKRDQLLKDGPDRISPLWWSTMTAAQQQAWTDYRQSLLDITDQPGFPAEIEWPVKP